MVTNSSRDTLQESWSMNLCVNSQFGISETGTLSSNYRHLLHCWLLLCRHQCSCEQWPSGETAALHSRHKKRLWLHHNHHNNVENAANMYSLVIHHNGTVHLHLWRNWYIHWKVTSKLQEFTRLEPLFTELLSNKIDQWIKEALHVKNKNKWSWRTEMNQLWQTVRHEGDRNRFKEGNINIWTSIFQQINGANWWILTVY